MASLRRPVRLFQGYNSIIADALDNDAVGGETSNTGAASSSSLTVCTSAIETALALKIDESLSASYLVESVDAKMEFFTELKLTTYSISIVVFARHGTGKTTGSNAQLRSNIVGPSKGNDEELNRFVQLYGDSYVSSVTQGGEYYGVYTFYSETEDEQTKLKLDMAATGIVDVVTVKASVQTNLTRFLKTVKTHHVFKENISGILDPSPPGENGLMEYASIFPSVKIDSPILIAFETSGYETVPDLVDRFEPAVKNRKYFLGRPDIVGGGLIGGDGLIGKLGKVTEILSQMRMINEAYRTYGGYYDATFHESKIIAREDYRAVVGQIYQYLTNPTRTFTSPNLPSIGNGTPVLQCEPAKSNEHGGDGGDPFDDVGDPRDFIQNKTHIVALQLKTTDKVNNLSVTYQRGAEDSDQWTASHGGKDGALSELKLDSGYFVDKVDGRSSKGVIRLRLTISDGDNDRILQGGGSGGDGFDPPIWRSRAKGWFVLGFFGRSGQDLNRIGVHYARFQPAKWIRLRDA